MKSNDHTSERMILTCKSGSKSNLRNEYDIEKNPEGNSVSASLEEKGRLQFFFHSPSSKYPIRDILNEQGKGYKTEPHIEIGAENYISCCYQSNNILPFLKEKEKYLFLFTTCRNKSLGERYYNRRFIVGYITKERELHFQKTDSCKPCKVAERCDGRRSARGSVKIFRFEDAYRLDHLISNPLKRKNTRIRKVTKPETDDILAHFNGKRNILDECIAEIRNLEDILEKRIRERVAGRNGKIPDKKNYTCRILRGGGCQFQDTDCLRWNIK